VNAYWLAQLLLRWIPPVLIGTNVIEVSFQTEHLGWKTDDFLITCEGAGGGRRRLAGQVKRTFSVSAADEECVKAMLDFWRDFQSPQVFSRDTDRLVLVVQRGTESLLGHFGLLLDCARASRDAADFSHRLSTPGFISKRAVHYHEQIGKIVGKAEGRVLDAQALWPFLRVLHVLNLDLDTATRQTESHIRGVLAYTVKEGHGGAVADSSWNALLRLAEPAMTQAHTFVRDDLPESLRDLHGSLGVKEQQILRALKEHSAPTLRKIRSSIGPELHLQRTAIVQQVLDELETTQVVIVSGPAGSGKSAIGKEVFERLAADHFGFAFRVEEFADAHIDAVLQAAQIPGNAEAITQVLAAQERKVILIESMERLLERSTRDAFSDLIGLAVRDPDMRLVITCRDYSTSQVRGSFFREQGPSHVVVSVPALTDPELDEVAGSIPKLARPLGHPPLRKILRNPFLLDQAMNMPWPADRPMPDNEREFRSYFWRNTVRVDRGQPGAGRKREQVLQEVALRRARALSEYIASGDLDPAVIASLKSDSLVVSPDEHPLLVATAHDVLEDWAILEWFEEQHLADTASFAELAAAIGTHPAVRRSYRKWVAELLERELAAADRLFLAAASDVKEGAQFRDDTLVAILRAPLAPDLLTRHKALLVANGCALLKRVIHLLRVACVAVPDWLRGLGGRGSLFNAPEGPAWPTVLQVVSENLAQFPKSDRMLLLGLIEDAVRTVSWWSPEAIGEPFVAEIAYGLLPHLRGYRSEDARGRVLKVIAKIPKADPVRFEALLRGSEADESGDSHREAEEFQDLLFSGTEGMPAARDLPKVTVSVAAAYLEFPEEELRNDRYRHYSTDVDVYFGIRSDRHHDFFPASAFRGPWVALLKNHPRLALDFYYKIFNRSLDWYTHPRVPRPLEEAWEIELTFADGTVKKQWGNARLWSAYRGFSVSPYALQSMLMALEKWLFEVAQTYPNQLDSILLDILRGSASASLSGVVASVAEAYPKLAGESLLVLLSAADYVRLDRARMAHESQGSAVANMFPQLQAESKFYNEERQKSNKLSHRRRDLEYAALTLQLGELAPRVHAILDRHTAALPPPQERTRDDLLWQLALRRMDLRQMRLGEPVSVAAPVDGTSADNLQTPSTYFPLELTALDPAVQKLVDEGTAKAQAMNQSLGLWMWALKLFKREATQAQQSTWRERLTEARGADREVEDELGERDGPGCVAAVCVRDHWDELTMDERRWCTSVVSEEILKTADQSTMTERVQRNDMAADRLCARVVPVLFTNVSEPERAFLRKVLAAAVLHPIEEVCWSAAWGVNDQVWRHDRSLALRCLNAIAIHASRVDDLWLSRDGTVLQPDEAEAKFASIGQDVRRAFEEPGGIPDTALVDLNLDGPAASDANARILAILVSSPEESVTVARFEQASRALVKDWDGDETRQGRRGHRRGGRRERNFQAEQVTKTRIQQYAMTASRENAHRVLLPILDAVDRHPREVYPIVQGLTLQEDRSPNTNQYWYLWDLFATRVKSASWVQSLDQEHPTGSEMLTAIFMNSYWKDDVRHWRSVEGHAHRVDALFEALPPAAVVFDSYLRFLYHIGERSLPQAFIRIEAALQRGDAAAMLAGSNSVFMLEVLLQRHVYGRPLELKRTKAQREAVLSLLDILVESGSSAAFRMRDDFVTPAN
jgi:hypothetical protein